VKEHEVNPETAGRIGSQKLSTGTTEAARQRNNHQREDALLSQSSFSGRVTLGNQEVNSSNVNGCVTSVLRDNIKLYTQKYNDQK
jgi:hypothetical protein